MAGTRHLNRTAVVILALISLVVIVPTIAVDMRVSSRIQSSVNATRACHAPIDQILRLDRSQRGQYLVNYPSIPSGPTPAPALNSNAAYAPFCPESPSTPVPTIDSVAAALQTTPRAIECSRRVRKQAQDDDVITQASIDICEVLGREDLDQNADEDDVGAALQMIVDCESPLPLLERADDCLMRQQPLEYHPAE